MDRNFTLCGVDNWRHRMRLIDVEEWKDISYYSHPRGAIVWVKDVELSGIDEARYKQGEEE